jgi:hypothetical protein
MYLGVDCLLELYVTGRHFVIQESLSKHEEQKKALNLTKSFSEEEFDLKAVGNGEKRSIL